MTAGGTRSSGVIVDDVRAEGNTLTATVSVSGDLRRFFSGEPFRAEYPVSIEDVPESVLVVPVLAHACPVAWTRNADVHVRTVDAEFAGALEAVQATLRRMYPRFIEGGDLVVDHLDERSRPRGAATAQLFTGGIDSLATYVRHREEAPALISVNGWTEPLDDDLWDRRTALLDGYADRFGVPNYFVRSNMLTFVDHTMLIAHFKRYVEGSWYSSVGHGVGLLGLCAPLAYAEDIGTLHVASTYTESYDHRWGSHPDIDDHVRWAGTRANHDGFELSRQEKVELLVEFMDATWPDMPIRTCIDEVDTNCGRCEKCSRTAVGLILAGRDPRRHGYEFDSARFDYVRDRLGSGAWDLKHAKYEWWDIQQHARYDLEFPIDGAEEFFRWLETVDVEALGERSRSPLPDRALRAVARNVPYPVYASLYPIYSRVSAVRSK